MTRTALSLVILDVGKIPKQWKKGEITPVYKKDCSLSKDNYRPLTILPALSKVFETLVHSRVSPRFRNILHKFVFAYRKHDVCDTALLSLTEEWRKELDDRKIIGLVPMDLSKAFDSLPHDLIVKKFKGTVLTRELLISLRIISLIANNE